MSDNPLADWLRARQDADVDPDGAGPQHATPLDGQPEGAGDAAQTSWPAWAGSPAAPGHEEPAPWERPPDEDAQAPPRRRRLLLLAAALPWAVAAGLGVVALGSGPAAEGERPGAAQGEQPESARSPATPAAEGFLAAAEPALGAAAALAVRLSITTADGGSDADGPRRYVDLAVPDGVHVAGDVVVVTVAAVMLEGSGERWHTSRPARFAVPLQIVDGQPVVVGDPWPLAVVPAAAEPPRWEPADADAEGVARALEVAGYREVEGLEVDGLEADSSGADARAASPSGRLDLLRARVWARAPGEPEARDHRVWLRADPQPAVLGAER